MVASVNCRARAPVAHHRGDTGRGTEPRKGAGLPGPLADGQGPVWLRGGRQPVPRLPHKEPPMRRGDCPLSAGTSCRLPVRAGRPQHPLESEWKSALSQVPPKVEKHCSRNV